jgi:N-acetyl-1-D-myo-inositol-2-amino-2-deoxy-alpha-D-glucopyranoside deacetylase
MGAGDQTRPLSKTFAYVVLRWMQCPLQPQRVIVGRLHMKTLLAILAHPDDESFGPGGTLARYAAAGCAVHYLCGTRGESGTVDAERMSGHASVAELRTAELACAGRELKLAGVHYLGYRDSGMQGSADNQNDASLFRAPLDEVAQRIAALFAQLKPDAVIAHDQFGGYGHPDHIKLHQATLRAYALHFGVTIDIARWNGDTAQPVVAATPARADAPGAAPPLYFAVFPKGLIRTAVRFLPLFRQDPAKFGRNKDMNLRQIASWEVPITTVIKTGEHAATKERASACHASQQPPSQGPLFLRLFFRLARGKEYFSRVYPPAEARRSEVALSGL